MDRILPQTDKTDPIKITPNRPVVQYYPNYITEIINENRTFTPLFLLLTHQDIWSSSGMVRLGPKPRDTPPLARGSLNKKETREVCSVSPLSTS